MIEQTDQNVFRVIDKPKVQEVAISCDLRPYGESYTAEMVSRFTFGDYFHDDDKFARLAVHYSAMHNANVPEVVVRLCNQLQRIWVSPLRPDGKTPSQDDFVKLSIENPLGFAALVRAISDASLAKAEIEAVEQEAHKAFTDAEQDTPE